VREAENMAADTREILRVFSSMIPLGGHSRRSHPDDHPPSPTSSGRSGRSSREDAVLACSCVRARASL
jgi:hypothetical protein